MRAKIQRFFKKTVWPMLHDVRSLGLMLFLVIVLLITWSGIKVIQSNYNLQKQISALQQQNSVQELQNNNLALQNEYYNTDQYLELSARQNFGLAQPGETELLVPKAVAMKNFVNLPTSQPQTASQPTSYQPAYQRNLQAWINFYLHRQSSD